MNNIEERPLSRRNLLQGSALAASSLALMPVAGCSRSDENFGSRELLELGAVEAIGYINDGSVTAERYVTELLAHSDRVGRLNAVITLNKDKVLENARAIDKTRAKGETLPPAAGLPFAVKDQIDVAGYPTTGGNGFFRSNIPARSARVVAALERAGAIVFAKTNMPDMVAGYDWAVAEASQNPYFGTPRNPYNPAHLSGGTSGGNAVALGARIVPAAIGEDTTGSIRFPAACCGVAGLRPSTYTVENAINDTNTKRYPDDGIVVPPAHPQDTWGPMARSVSDVAFLDRIVTGEAAARVDLANVRLGVPEAGYWDSEFINPGLAEVVREGLDRLKRSGATLVPLDFEAVRELSEDKQFQAALRRPFNRDLKAWLERHLPGVTPEQVYSRRADQSFPPREQSKPVEMPTQRRVQILRETARRYLNVYTANGIAAIAFPTIPIPAPPLQKGPEIMHTKILVRGKPIDQTLALARNIFWGPRLGGPGLNIPFGLTKGLPVGVEFTAVPGADRQLLGLGLAAENALGRIPPPQWLQ